jgi:hypothetical protein
MAAKEPLQVGLNVCPIDTVGRPRSSPHGRGIAKAGGCWQGAQAAPRLHRVPRDQLRVGLKGTEALEVLGGKLRAVGGDGAGILARQAEGDA